MKQLDIALQHIKLLYAILLVVLVLNIGYNAYTYNFDNIIVSAKDGYAEGLRSSDHSHREHTFKLYEILYNPVIKSNNKQIIYAKDSAKVEIETWSFDVLLNTGQTNPQSVWLRVASGFFGFIGCVAAIWALILTLRLIINLGRSIIKKEIFNSSTIRLCRWYALMIAIYSTSFGVHTYMTDITVAPYLEGTQWEFIPSFPFDLSTLTIAILIYIFSEILNIGKILKQEQELTI